MSNEITVNEATHANKIGYSDVYPFEIMEKRTDRKLMVREMEAELDPEWKCETVIGGFAGHCTNNRSQKYTYYSNEEYTIKAIRLDKYGNWKDKFGNCFLLNTHPYKFYDYNF